LAARHIGRFVKIGGFKLAMADLMVRPNGGGRGLVSDLFGFDPLRAVFGNQGSYGFAGEVQKTEDGWNVEIPVPGFKPDQIDVTVEDRVLTVTGKTGARSSARSCSRKTSTPRRSTPRSSTGC
jgi:HSP20 family molecular chaperone IbpA